MTIQSGYTKAAAANWDMIFGQGEPSSEEAVTESSKFLRDGFEQYCNAHYPNATPMQRRVGHMLLDFYKTAYYSSANLYWSAVQFAPKMLSELGL